MVRPLACSSLIIDLILAAALASLGLAGLPSFAAEQSLRDGRLQRALPQWIGTTLTLYAAMRTRVFVDFLVASFGGVPPMAAKLARAAGSLGLPIQR